MFNFRSQQWHLALKIAWMLPAFLAILMLVRPAIGCSRCVCHLAKCGSDSPAESIKKVDCRKCCGKKKSDRTTISKHFPKKKCCLGGCPKTDADGNPLPCQCRLVAKGDVLSVLQEKHPTHAHFFLPPPATCSIGSLWASLTSFSCLDFHLPQLRLYLFYGVLRN